MRLPELSGRELKVAGLVPFSTVDWPGKLTATLFLQGCPWRCPYCHNASILDPRAPGQVPWDEVMALLGRRRGLLDGVVFSGGEALMQAGPAGEPLAAALRQVRDLGYQTGLHTAGAYPRALTYLLDEGLLDWVGLDIKALPEQYELASGTPAAASRAEESLAALAADRGVDWEVRLTLWPPLVEKGKARPGHPDTKARRLAGDNVIACAAPDLLESRGTQTSAELIAYAVEVAKWCRERAAKNFALQHYRVPPVDPGPQTTAAGVELAEPGQELPWDDDAALAALNTIGFEKVTVR